MEANSAGMPPRQIPPPPPIGPILREYRRCRELTQEELAQRAGLSMRYISLVETGKNNPTVAAVGRILHVLNISWSQLAKQLDEL